MDDTSTSARGAPSDWPGLVERPGSGDRLRGWPPGVTAVLIHGAMDRGAGMARLVRSLSDAPTIRYDRRGYGRARTLPVGGLVRHVDDLIRIVGHRPVVLFGHSYGGLVALAAAAGGRLDIRAIAVYEVPGPWLDGWPHWSLGSGDDRPVSDDEAGDVAERFLRSMIGDGRWEHLPARTRADRRAEGRALLADVDPTVSAGVPFEAARISVPVVLGTGTASPHWYADAAEWIAARLPNAELRHLAGGTHGAPLDRPDDVGDLIRLAAAG